MRFLIYSSNKLFGECLCSGLALVESVTFTRHVWTIEDAVALARSESITSVLIDVSDESQGTLVAQLSRDIPGVCILALSVDDTQATQIVKCARLGYHGIVPRNTAIQGVVRIVRAAERGEVSVRDDVAALMMRALAHTPVEPTSERLTGCLTRREKEVCSLVCEGLSNKEIALEVNRSVGTIKNHVQTILSKLDLPRRGTINAYLGFTRQQAKIQSERKVTN